MNRWHKFVADKKQEQSGIFPFTDVDVSRDKLGNELKTFYAVNIVEISSELPILVDNDDFSI